MTEIRINSVLPVANVDSVKSYKWAVVLSDAYYGDPSSVVQVYKKTGKPIMIQNVDVI